jgi:hypothetical protein
MNDPTNKVGELVFYLKSVEHIMLAPSHVIFFPEFGANELPVKPKVFHLAQALEVPLERYGSILTNKIYT